jgi:iron-only hydrogenase group A
MLFNVEINGITVNAKRDETILALLNRHGIKVPTLCHMNGFTPTGACRMCIVEVEGMPGLVPSCSHPVEEWMKISTHSPRVLKARKSIVELLLANHPDDCLYCDRIGACELHNLADELNIHERKYRCKKKFIQVDRNCDSIDRDPGKCILCGRCIRICDEIIGVSAIEIVGRGSKSSLGTSMNSGHNEKACVKCGQCILVCPTNALKEKMTYPNVIDALNNKDLHCVVQFSPTVPVSIAEEYGLKSGKDVPNLLRTALRRIGFKQIFDLSFGADLNIMETSAEFIHRISEKQKLPLFTSCCPSWVRYIEEVRPEFKENLASAKSPQLMMGAIIKNYFTARTGIASNNIFTVTIMPCTSKKHEARNEILQNSSFQNVDAVITIRELIKMFRLYGIDFSTLEAEQADSYFGMQSSAGRLYGTAGGTLEGIIRTLIFQLTGQEIQNYKIMEMRGFKGRKETKIKIGKTTFGFAAVSGLSNVKTLLDEIKAGRDDLHLIEIMACPGGCINGGGQRLGSDEKLLRSRMKALYDSDEEEMIRAAHKNPLITELYDQLLGSPLSEKSKNLLHN